MNKWCALNFDIQFYEQLLPHVPFLKLHALLLLALFSDKGKN